MSDHVLIDRLQFTLTISFHYIFPLLTIGLALLIVYFKTVSYKGREDHRIPLLRKTPQERAEFESTSRFWMKIFAVNFAFGVVTGIPMEFQFGTNWSGLSNFAGGVIGQTLALEGMFAFILESAFLGIFLLGAQRVGPRIHWLSSIAIFLGSWLSAYFIVATNAWMQHPVAYSFDDNGDVQLDSIWGLLTNEWLAGQYPHVVGGAVVVGGFVMAAMGAFYKLTGRHEGFARICLHTGVVAALVATALQIFPSGDTQGRNLAEHQPVTLAAMEGLFESSDTAPLAIIGNPNTETRELESAIEIPDLLTFLTYRRLKGEVQGLNSFPEEQWPDSVPLVYYAYHIMVGLGTIMLAIALLAGYLMWRRRLTESRPMLWTLMLVFPFAYIANMAGWVTAETGRQPWTVHGLLRTEDAATPESAVPAGTGLFTLLGFAGLYLMMGVLFLMLILRIVAKGPEELDPDDPSNPLNAPGGDESKTATA